MCPPGYTEIGLNLNLPARTLVKCVLCGTGTFKSHYGNSACTPCPTGESATEQRTACTAMACPSGEVPASTWNGPTVSFACKPCGANSYRAAKDVCLPCAEGKVQPAAAADQILVRCETVANLSTVARFSARLRTQRRTRTRAWTPRRTRTHTRAHARRRARDTRVG